MNFKPILTFAWAILMLAGCAKSDDEGPAETEEAVQAPAKP